MFIPREGQWVKVKHVVGIWYKGQFHEVNETGETVRVLNADMSALTPVTNVKDLPLSRRTHLPSNYNPHTRTPR